MTCPICNAEEIESNSPRTVYACGTSDYDQRHNTFTQSINCREKKIIPTTGKRINERNQYKKQPLA